MSVREEKIKRLIVLNAWDSLIRNRSVIEMVEEANRALSISLDNTVSTLQMTEYSKHVTGAVDFNYLIETMEKQLVELNKVSINVSVLKDMIDEMCKKIKNLKEL